MPFGVSHTVIRKLAYWTMKGFFSDTLIIDPENVPEDGPLIVCCTHWNMIVDVAMLSSFFPHDRKLHYWAKSTIFVNKPVSDLLRSAGNIPVDRKNKDNQALFAGTFEVLKLGEAVAIFPEGTSYTEPGLQAIKEGCSWTALEYAKNLRLTGDVDSARDATVVVASVVYTAKTNYRSRAVMRFSKPIDTKPYIDRFCAPNASDTPESGGEGQISDAKQAVRDLTKEIRDKMVEMTVNAEQWSPVRAAETARQLLWGDDDRVPLRYWTEVTQSLVDLFKLGSSSDSVMSSQIASVQKILLEYEENLRVNKFTNAQLNALPLPRILDPLQSAPPPDRLRSLWALMRTTFSAFVFLPFFILPFLAHLPIYVLGKFSQVYINPIEQEAFAQNKIVFSLLALIFLIYPTIFFFTWLLFLGTPLGFVIAVGWTAGFAVYHTYLVDRNYTRWKRLVAAWRVLVGLWLGPGGTETNKTRKMLKLRSDAAKSVADLMVSLENGKKAPRTSDGSSDGADTKEWSERVGWYRSLGARIGQSQMALESDSTGRLKSS